MNEELRSATEELETSREELQSINEELTTVNQELKSKVDELSHANSDLQNLMAATAIATVFLDREPVHHALHAVGGRAVQPDPGRRRPAAQPTSPTASTTRSSTPTPRACSSTLVPIEREVALRRALAPRAPAALPHGDDRIAGVVLTFVDITERRRVSEALRESEALFRTIVTQAAAGVAHLDLDGRITLANARFALIAGRTPEALVGTSAFALVHPDDQARNVEAFRRLAADGAPFEMEKRYVRGDGSVVWVQRLGDGACSTPTTGRRRRSRSSSTSATGASTEQALRESEERLRLIVDNAREYAILTLDLKRRITGWNSGAESLTRLRRRRGHGRERRHHLHRRGPRRRRAAARGGAGARPKAAPPTSAGTAGRTAAASGAAA